MTTTEQTMTATPEEHGTKAAVPAVIDATSTDVALIDTEGDQWGDVDDGDMSPDGVAGLLTLLPFNAKLGGGFTDPETGETGVLDLDFVWMAKNRTRAYWADAFGKGDAAPGCRSFDGVKADPSSPDLQNGGDCSTCPMAQWDGDGAPACRESIEAMAFIPDPHGFGRVVRLRFSGLSVAPARNYWRSFNERIPKRPPIAYLTHITLEQVDTDNGAFLKARFERVNEFSRQQAQPLIEERDRRLEEWKALVASDVATATMTGEGPFDEAKPEPFADDDAPASSQPIHRDDVAGRFGASEEDF